MSQEKLAEELGLTRQTISKWELNQSTPDLQYIIQMSTYFNVTMDYLVKGETTVINENPKYESEQDGVKKQNSVIGYKWSFIMGLVLVAVSVLGMTIFAVCAAINPYEYCGVDDVVYRGLAGFLRATESQGFFMALNFLFIYGVGFAGWGIYKQMHPSRNDK